MNSLTDFDVATFHKQVKGKNREEIMTLYKSLVRQNVVFHTNFLSSFPWLAYSSSLDGSFCLACTLFGHNFPSKNSRVNLLYDSPLRDWSSALKRFQLHEGSHKS